MIRTIADAAEDVSSDKWMIVAIVVPLAGFTAWLVRWILQQYVDREKALSARDAAREQRESRRVDAQTQALQEIVTELQRLSEQHTEHARAIEDVPARVVERLEQRKTA